MFVNDCWATDCSSIRHVEHIGLAVQMCTDCLSNITKTIEYFCQLVDLVYVHIDFTFFLRREVGYIRHKQSLFKLEILMQNVEHIFSFPIADHIEQQVFALGPIEEWEKSRLRRSN